MSESTWQQFLGVLRQISSLKKSGSTGVAVDALVEEAWDLWPELPPPPPGKPRIFPPDTLGIARELGFDRTVIKTEEIEPLAIEDDPALTAGIAEASRLQKLASEIDKAITEAGGVGNVTVACSQNRVVLTGIAADEDARDDAQIVAAKLAPGMEIDNSITVA